MRGVIANEVLYFAQYFEVFIVSIYTFVVLQRLINLQKSIKFMFTQCNIQNSSQNHKLHSNIPFRVLYGWDTSRTTKMEENNYGFFEPDLKWLLATELNAKPGEEISYAKNHQLELTINIQETPPPHKQSLIEEIILNPDTFLETAEDSVFLNQLEISEDYLSESLQASVQKQISVLKVGQSENQNDQNIILPELAMDKPTEDSSDIIDELLASLTSNNILDADTEYFNKDNTNETGITSQENIAEKEVNEQIILIQYNNNNQNMDVNDNPVTDSQTSSTSLFHSEIKIEEIKSFSDCITMDTDDIALGALDYNDFNRTTTEYLNYKNLVKNTSSNSELELYNAEDREDFTYLPLKNNCRDSTNEFSTNLNYCVIDNNEVSGNIDSFESISMKPKINILLANQTAAVTVAGVSTPDVYDDVLCLEQQYNKNVSDYEQSGILPNTISYHAPLGSVSCTASEENYVPILHEEGTNSVKLESNNSTSTHAYEEPTTAFESTSTSHNHTSSDQLTISSFNFTSNSSRSQRKRGRPSVKPNAPDEKVLQNLNEDERKKILQRYKNNEASRESRKKRKLMELSEEQERNRLEEEYQELERRHSILTQHYDSLKKEFDRIFLKA